MARKKPPYRKGKNDTPPVDAGHVGGDSEGVEPDWHERVSPPPSPTQAAEGRPAEELPPFDESRAIPAEDLSYGRPKKKRRGRPDADPPSEG